MAKLKLGAITDDKSVKLTVELPAAVHRDLLAYAEVLASFCRETPDFLMIDANSPVKLGQTDGGCRLSPGNMGRFSSRFPAAYVGWRGG